jgi:hypothetical protein
MKGFNSSKYTARTVSCRANKNILKQKYCLVIYMTQFMCKYLFFEQRHNSLLHLSTLYTYCSNSIWTHLRQKRPMQGLMCLLWNPCMWTHKLGRSPHGFPESGGSGSCLHLCFHGKMDLDPHDNLSDMVNHHQSKHQQRKYVHQTTVNSDVLWHLFIKHQLI